MELTPVNLLQVNATVITGLLILLTVQSYSEEIRPLQDHNEWHNKILQLETEQYALENTLKHIQNKTTNLISIENQTASLISNDNQTIALLTNERLDKIQEMSDDVSTRLVEVMFTIEKMKNTQFKIIDKYGKITTIEEQTSKPSYAKTMQTYGIAMLIPFIASSMFVIAMFLEDPKKIRKIEKGFTTAKYLTLLGFGSILVSLVVFTFVTQFG
ncbi:hypothetical protein [Nitrosopumilus sp.]|uniref:hypothetical protein n=1 Tax=Nitrosopumilus sp. TaxID=2024843 RepID=UPI00247E59BA|nr:hypothetical protein [Nitrosopumilus sp.]MCV0431480.1 hypothetical protein [Nitrosopumilus sp.]